MEEPTFFVTINTRRRFQNQLCVDPTGTGVLQAIRKYHDDQKWFCSVALLMPDHVHLLNSLSPEFELVGTVSLWKRYLAKAYRIEWQENFFEHRLRGNESADAKWHYIVNNPVRAKLTARWQDWKWLWFPSDLVVGKDLR